MDPMDCKSSCLKQKCLNTQLCFWCEKQGSISNTVSDHSVLFARKTFVKCAHDKQ